MCKPAAEVANLTQFESHSTRARAMLLWRVLQGMIDWTPRAVELLYESTLDSISEAWCISHYPVSAYVLAARAEVYAAGLAPDTVRAAVDSGAVDVADFDAIGDVLFLAGEIAEWGDVTLTRPALTALEHAGLTARPVLALSGAAAYALGALDVARQQAEHIAALIRSSGARTVITDSPQTLWALRCAYPTLGVSLPDGVRVVSLLETLADCLRAGSFTPATMTGMRALLHDSRSAALLADSLPLAQAIQPGYVGDESTLGTGTIYDAPRILAQAMGVDSLYSVWTRALSRSSGADDSLWRTYPALAEGLARQRLQTARDLGAERVITDSPLQAAHLGRFAGEFDLKVHWLVELLVDGSA
jgi:Fe-S oxidoreductase